MRSIAVFTLALASVLTEPLLPGSSGFDDVAAGRSVDANGQVARAEKNVRDSLDQLFERLEIATQAVNGKDLLGERLAIAELRPIVDRLLEQVSLVLEAHQEYRESAILYRTELEKAQPRLMRASDDLHDFALKEPNDDLKRQYLMAAEIFEAVHAKYRKTRDRIGPSLDAVQGSVEYTLRTQLFLTRFKSRLAYLPEETEATTRFLRQLARYVASFDTFREKLAELHRASTRSVRDQKPDEDSPTPVKGSTQR